MDTNIVHENDTARNPYGDVITDSRGATWYYCSTARRYFQPTTQPRRGKRGMMWVQCTHCDTSRLVKNRDPNYHEDAPQPHAYYVEEAQRCD
jgi:DNA-directed RNA polymerase subunit RPC12/RpoP